MRKTNYPVNVINAKKIDKSNIAIINETFEVKKYQNLSNRSYSHYKPISKLFRFRK